MLVDLFHRLRALFRRADVERELAMSSSFTSTRTPNAWSGKDWRPRTRSGAPGSRSAAWSR